MTQLGEVLLVDHMVPLGMTVNGLAEYLGIPASQVRGIICGQVQIDGQIATTFAEMFRTTPGFWLNLQAEYVLEVKDLELSTIFDGQDGSIGKQSKTREDWRFH